MRYAYTVRVACRISPTALAVCCIMLIPVGVQGYGFECSFNITGNNIAPQPLTFDKVLISCKPDQAAAATGIVTLPMLLHTSLEPFGNRFTGITSVAANCLHLRLPRVNRKAVQPLDAHIRLPYRDLAHAVPASPALGSPQAGWTTSATYLQEWTQSSMTRPTLHL